MRRTRLLTLLLAIPALAQTPIVDGRLPAPAVAGTVDYEPDPFSAVVGALVDTVTAADIDAGLDFICAPATRFALTDEAYATGSELAQRLGGLGYDVEVDAFYTALGLQSVAAGDGVCCLVGSAGLLYTSTNGGTDWIRRDDGSRPLTLNETAVAVGEPRRLSAGGAQTGYLQSDDGGASWYDVELPLEGNYSVTGIQRPAADDVHLTLWGAGGGVYYSSPDNGATWQSADLGFGPQPYGVLGLEFLDTQHGWACGYRDQGQSRLGYISRTTDGGASWTPWSFSGPIVVNVSFADELHGYACGNDLELILATDDGGASWTEVHRFDRDPEAGAYEYLGDIEALSAEHAVAVGYGGVVLETTDGGANWSYLREPAEDPDSASRISLTVIDDEHWIACGDGALEMTTDGGANWTSRLADLGLPPALNIFAHREGSAGTEGPLLIAPYDCYSEDPWFEAPGADANGSGTAALLAVAQALAGLEPARGCGFLFTSTRYLPGGFSLSGGTRFTDTHPDYRPEAVLDLEAVGYTSDAALDLYLLGNAPEQELMDALADYAAWYVDGLEIQLLYNALPAYDVGAFWQIGVPAVYCSEYYVDSDERNFNHGTVEDTRDTLNPRLILLAARLAAAFAAAEADFTGGIELGPREPYAYPNPFRPAGHEAVTFTGLPPGGEVRVYTLDGTLVHTGSADDGPYDDGDGDVWRHVWDGGGDAGQSLAAGVYLYRVEGPDGHALGKLTLIR